MLLTFFLLLLICSFGIRFLYISKLFSSFNYREILLITLVITGGISWVFVESFTLFDQINYSSARIYWVLISAIELGIYGYIKKNGPLRKHTSLNLTDLFNDATSKVVLIGSAIIVIPLFLLALLTPPNNFDSNNYHLHRIIEWTANGNVNHYPTQFIQQLYHNVFAEYKVLNLFLITGTDQFFNLVQFCYGLGAIVAITLLASILGLDKKTQLLCGFILLTLPISIFELTTTQVDYTALFYFLTFLYFGFKLTDQYSWPVLAIASISLAFGIFTKYPIAFYSMPFCIYFGWAYLKKYQLKKSLVILVVFATSISLVFAPFFSRNYQLFNHIVSPQIGSPLAIEKLPTDSQSLAFTLSSILKNSSLHLGLPHSGYNKTVENVIINIHNIIGVDINQKEISEDQFEIRYSVQEDMIPNTFHFLFLILFTLLILFKGRNKKILIIWGFAILGFTLYCTALRFQLWSTRTHMALFAVGSILLGYALSLQKPIIRNTVLVILYLPALIFVFGNPSKPIVPFTYKIKQISNHVPAYVCQLPEEKKEEYKQALNTYYNFDKEEHLCFQILQTPSSNDKKDIFEKLDQLGYFESIKKTVFNMDRTELYFINDKEKYHQFVPLLPSFLAQESKIGVISTKKEGFYFHNRAFKTAHGVDPHLRYIFYKKELDQLPNANRPFEYKYVLADNLPIAKELLGDENIVNVTQSNNLSLIELKEPQSKTYTF